MKEYANFPEGEKELVNALTLAKQLGHEVWIKNYDEGYMREEGEPDYIGFDFENILVDDSIETDAMPSYEGNGCNDVFIEVKDNAQITEYPVWYSDNEEDRIYTDEIKAFLEKVSA